MFRSEYDIYTMYDNGMAFFPHSFNDACLVNDPYGAFRRQKLDNVRVSNDNTKHKCMPLTNDCLVTCLKILHRIGLTNNLHVNYGVNVLEFKSSVSFFHPYGHVPRMNPKNDINISPVKGCTFAACK